MLKCAYKLWLLNNINKNNLNYKLEYLDSTNGYLGIA